MSLVRGAVLAVLLPLAGAWCDGGRTFIPIPARPLSLEMEAPVAPVELRGLCVEDEAGVPAGRPLSLSEGGTYRWFFQMEPAEPAPEALRLSARIESSGAVRTMTVPLSSMEGGVLSREWRLEPVFGSGDSVLRVALERCAADGGVEKSWPLAVMPLFVSPVAESSAVKAEKITGAFGADAIRLDRRFRIGPGAGMTLPVDEKAAGRKIRAVAVVSSVAWLPWRSLAGWGRPMATLSVAGEQGFKQEFPLRLGPDILPNEEPLVDQMGLDRRGRAALFEAWKTGGGQPRQRYRTVIALDRPAALHEITLTHAWTRGMVLVDEVVLLPEKS